MQAEKSELQKIIQTIWSSELYKIILSNPTGEGTYRKIVLNRQKKGWQAEQYTEKQVFHENLPEGKVQDYLMENMSSAFRQCGAWDGTFEHTVRISKKGKVTGMKKRTAQTEAPKAKMENNRKKNYLLEEGTVIPPLVDMGIFTVEGKVVRSMYDKYRQINRFVELIDDEIDALPKDQTIRIIDFGCGKSYLTFILYHYFTNIRKISVHMTGLDLKEDVIEKCNLAAKKYGYENLHFELGDICGYQSNEQVDMVITLHACDTATDHALYHAVRWNTEMIFSVPCCQHELNSQIQSENYSILTRYGLIKERTAALMTDAIRANLLEACGYKTDILEFVDFAHTPKNLLIRAKKKPVSKDQKEKRIREVERLMQEYHLQPTFYQLLKEASYI